MRKFNLLGIKFYCDTIIHCGDYGMSYISNDMSELYIVLGDADNVDFEELEYMLSAINVKLTVEAECGPDEDNYTLISRGVEAQNYDQEYPEDGEVEDGYVIPKHLSIEEYLDYLKFYENLPD